MVLTIDTRDADKILDSLSLSFFLSFSSFVDDSNWSRPIMALAYNIASGRVYVLELTFASHVVVNDRKKMKKKSLKLYAHTFLSV